MPRQSFSRRHFLAASSASILGVMSPLTGESDDRKSAPIAKNPKAIDGDDVAKVNWDERFTMTVGPKQADLVGTSDRVMQAAVDYVARLGGGTVRILPGTYTLRNSVYLPSRIRLLGSGDDSIITKIPSETIELADDSDWYDQEITLSKSGAFRIGDGVVLKTKNPHNGSTDVIKRTLVARKGKRFKLNDGIRKNLWLSGKPTVSSLFPLLTSEHTSDVLIENLTLDGNRKHNANLNGNYGGCIFLQDCNRYAVKNVTARNYNGDGISFQICHDVRIENCRSHDHAGLGLHPGSGSQRPVILNNRMERNHIGLFWCWGVRYGLAERNRMDGNTFGISIGHRDTDNVMRDNDVLNSGKVGILFRNDARGKDFWANRNLIVNNRVHNSGGDDGIAIDIQGKTTDITVTGNDIKEKRKPMQRRGIRIAADAGRVSLAENRIEGFAVPIEDLRQA